MSEMTQETMKYFEEYRNKLAELNQKNQKISAHDRELEGLRQDMYKMHYEIEYMRQIITSMIDNGWDPVEAKLKQSNNDIDMSLWNGTVVEAYSPYNISNNKKSVATGSLYAQCQQQSGSP